MAGKAMTRIGALISGTGSNLQAVANACNRGAINGKVAFVGSDNPKSQGLAWADRKGLPVFAVDFQANKQNPLEPTGFQGILDNVWREQKDFFQAKDWDKGYCGFHTPKDYLRWKLGCEQMMLEQIKRFQFDLLVLAGYMQFCTAYFIDRIAEMLGPYRIMNIHPALLPAFPGTNGYGAAWRKKVKVHGCTVHFLDYGEDTGPIIGQMCYRRYYGDTFEVFKRRGLELEHRLLPACIRAFAEDAILETEQNGRPGFWIVE